MHPQMHMQEDAGTLFEGLTFVLTGTLPTLSRAQAQEMIRKNGGKADRKRIKEDQHCSGRRKRGQ